jgi:glycerol-3-phosphate dehydrogenase (NAD(P)+)
MRDIGVLGAGAFGTALAVHWAAAGHRVQLWGRSRQTLDEIAAKRQNSAYLAGVEIPAGVELTADLRRLAPCELLVVAVPSYAFRGVLREWLAAGAETGPRVVVSATKGIEPESLERMSEVTRQEGEAAGRKLAFAVLSGPTFAAELARGFATAAVVACDDEALAPMLREELASPTLRLYSSHDVVGVELGGTAKNVIAIAAGVVSGLGLGHNTLAALITRGLHEITRLGHAWGGDPRTFPGLAGLGDLVLTCTGDLSRNRAVGVALGQGDTLEHAQDTAHGVAEGVRNSLAVAQLARKKGVDMPITEQMVEILHHGKSPPQALQDLMTRERKAEAEIWET